MLHMKLEAFDENNFLIQELTYPFISHAVMDLIDGKGVGKLSFL